MTKLRLLALLAVVALVLSPAMALAQGGMSLPCRWYGTVQVNGADVPDGTMITATIEGDTYNAATPAVYGASTYALEIEPPEGTTYTEGAEVTFMIGDQAADQTSAWEAGGNIELNLSVGEAGPTPVPGTGITGVEVNMLEPGATASAEINDAGVLILNIPGGEQGPQGPEGPEGPKGDTGEQGEPGSDASIVIPIIALVIAVIAILMSVAVMRRKV